MHMRFGPIGRLLKRLPVELFRSRVIFLLPVSVCDILAWEGPVGITLHCLEEVRTSCSPVALSRVNHSQAVDRKHPCFVQIRSTRPPLSRLVQSFLPIRRASFAVGRSGGDKTVTRIHFHGPVETPGGLQPFSVFRFLVADPHKVAYKLVPLRRETGR